MTVRSGRPARSSPVGHAVLFYEDDRELADEVGAHLRNGLVGAAAAIVVATPEHRRIFEQRLWSTGIEVGRAELLTVDAEEALGWFMTGGRPDPVAFDHTIGAMLRGAAAGGRPVVVYGELVALLWERGEIGAAIELESIWNELLDDVAFTLLCAYPREVATGDDGPAVRRICELHTEVAGLAGPGSAGAVPKVSQRFPCTLVAPGEARRFVSDWLARWRRTDLIEPAEIVVSELATNAVTHAHSPFVLTLAQDGSKVRLEVTDRSTDRPEVRHPRLDDPHGRGMQLVAAIADTWGTRADGDGKTVWAVFAR